MQDAGTPLAPLPRRVEQNRTGDQYQELKNQDPGRIAFLDSAVEHRRSVEKQYQE
ncbi:hypothetical protein SDC9_179497 [bioreactor metagenome]|uniref:Uncharacterized protein n=1 Tax=bioreactor metagenome TaxID=1076179 RepID=A0A645H130_9ZZZZ